MATRKQRRRREKEKRHDYEIVYVDDEGNEVEPEEPVKAPAKRAAGKGSRGSAPSTRGRRTPQPPSWRRVAKRGALLGPLFIAAVLLLGGKHMTVAAAILQTLILLVFFIPFSYLLDSFVWRSHQKRQGGGGGAASKR